MTWSETFTNEIRLRHNKLKRNQETAPDEKFPDKQSKTYSNWSGQHCMGYILSHTYT